MPRLRGLFIFVIVALFSFFWYPSPSNGSSFKNQMLKYVSRLQFIKHSQDKSHHSASVLPANLARAHSQRSGSPSSKFRNREAAITHWKQDEECIYAEDVVWFRMWGSQRNDAIRIGELPSVGHRNLSPEGTGHTGRSVARDIRARTEQRLAKGACFTAGLRAHGGEGGYLEGAQVEGRANGVKIYEGWGGLLKPGNIQSTPAHKVSLEESEGCVWYTDITEAAMNLYANPCFKEVSRACTFTSI